MFDFIFKSISNKIKLANLIQDNVKENLDVKRSLHLVINASAFENTMIISIFDQKTKYMRQWLNKNCGSNLYFDLNKTKLLAMTWIIRD